MRLAPNQAAQKRNLSRPANRVVLMRNMFAKCFDRSSNMSFDAF
jgi:hypothetical protein